VDYTWKAFTDCYFDGRTLGHWNEVSKITRAISHRIQSKSAFGIRKFAENMISRIDSVSNNIPSINLSAEKKYFESLLI